MTLIAPRDFRSLRERQALAHALSRNSFDSAETEFLGKRAIQHDIAYAMLDLPGLHARVDHWSADRDLVFIEFTLHAEFGRDTLCWPTINRLVLRDGKAIERVTYFDPLAVLPTLLRHPSVWWQWHNPLTAPAVR